MIQESPAIQHIENVIIFYIWKTENNIQLEYTIAHSKNIILLGEL